MRHWIGDIAASGLIAISPQFDTPGDCPGNQNGAK
jgi:hypothetical protein